MYPYHLCYITRRCPYNTPINIQFLLSFQVHLELAKYHEMYRFSENGEYDKNAALFHLKSAADCGIVTAIVNMAKLYCDLPHDIL